MRHRVSALAIAGLLLSSPSAIAQDWMPSFSFEAADGAESGHVVVFVNGEEDLSQGAAAIDAATDGRLAAALEAHEFKGSFGKSMTFNALPPFQTVTVLGAGEDALTKRQLHDLGGHAAAHAAGDETVTLVADGLTTAVTGKGAHVAKGFALRSYRFTKYQPEEEVTSADVTVQTGSPATSRTLYTGDLGHVVEGISLTRDLGTEPGNGIWPQAFVEKVQGAFRGVGNIELDVLDADDIRREGMGALMGVGQGSIHDPRLLVISYEGDPGGEAPIALVGKGITFDTGGISIKPNTGMWQMKSDLSGAAAVAGTVLAAAKRGERINVVGLMPLAENMPSQDAIRPGDVLTTMGGGTIEVMSTDAEGRLLLADAVQYAQENFEPRMLLNIATLTGSAVRAVGDEYAVVITRDMDLSVEMMEIGKQAGEDVWPLPLHPNHFDQISSPIATIKSTGGTPGASIGAAVVGTFVEEDLPWVHLDIAGVDWMESSRPTIPAGHAGWGVRFMDELLREESE